MSVIMSDAESGFSEADIHFARQTFYRDCPNGRCSKEKFLTFIRQSQKPVELNRHLMKVFQNYRQSKKFFSMMFDIYDRNHDGELDFDEYLYALSAISGANRLRTIETLFNFFDVHNQGSITREEFNSRKKLAAQFLGHYQTGIQDTLLYNQAFNAMDSNNDGHISREEFIQWHLKDHLLEETKPMKKRTRLLRNLSTLVDLRGQVKTSSLQNRETTTTTTSNYDHHHDQTSTLHADRYLLKIFRRARNRFHHHETNNITDNQSDSGMFTASSITNFTDENFDGNSLLDINENDFQSTHDDDDERLCQSLEDALMKTLLEIREQRKQLNQNLITEDQQSFVIRL